MLPLSSTELSKLLEEIAQSIDIPDSLFSAAEQSYQAVGAWLGSGSSPLASFSSQIYTQGSFRLGVVTKPPSETDEYDLDLVFELDLSKAQISQQRLKNIVGDRLKANETYRKILDTEGRRCWTLQYANSAQFHMDILPAIPDQNIHPVLESQGVPVDQAHTSIAITDNTRSNFTRIDTDWPRSNPKGYATWFHQQMLIRFVEQRKRFAEAYKARLEDVPEYQVKTPLQRCIQLLKRHRDLLFVGTPDIKPASIILTTLAARAYRNEADMLEALVNIVEGMPAYIENLAGMAWVPNPVDPTENFADRWRENPDREPAFRTWLKQVHAQVRRLSNCDDLNDLGELLVTMFGEKVATGAVDRYKDTAFTQTGSDSVVEASSRRVVDIRPMKPWGWK